MPEQATTDEQLREQAKKQAEENLQRFAELKALMSHMDPVERLSPGATAAHKKFGENGDELFLELKQLGGTSMIAGQEYDHLEELRIIGYEQGKPAADFTVHSTGGVSVVNLYAKGAEVGGRSEDVDLPLGVLGHKLVKTDDVLGWTKQNVASPSYVKFPPITLRF